MNSHGGFHVCPRSILPVGRRVRAGWPALACLAVAQLIAGWRATGEEALPAPAQAITSQASVVFQANLEGVAGTGIGQALKAKLPDIAQQLKSVPGMPAGLSERVGAFSALRLEDIAEVVVAMEGNAGAPNLATAAADPNFGFVAVVRLVASANWKQVADQLLQALDRQKAGLRAQVEKTKKQVGAADSYDLPAEVFGGKPPPFAVSAAVGPASEGGGVVAVGRSESLGRYLRGQGGGQLPAAAKELISQRGQVWLYVDLPEAAMRELPMSTPGAPLPPAMAAGLQKLRGLGLSLKFADTGLGIEVALKLTDAGAAQEMANGLQGMVAMFQMAGAQSGRSAPSSLSRLKLAASGAVFRLTIEMSAQELEQGLAGAAGVAGMSRPRPVVRPAPPPAEPTPAAPPPPSTAVEVAFVELLPGQGETLRQVRLRLDNHTPKAVREIEVTFQYIDASGRRLKEWTSQHQDPNADTLVGGNTQRVVECPVFNVPSLTKTMNVTLRRVVFADGEKWSPPR